MIFCFRIKRAYNSAHNSGSILDSAGSRWTSQGHLQRKSKIITCWSLIYGKATVAKRCEKATIRKS